MKGAIFLDRDGTVIRDPGYISDPALIEPLPGALEVLSKLSGAGWPLIVISNQSGVGRGLISGEQMLRVQRAFEDMMRAAGAPIAATYVCIHAPQEHCECRKPSPSLVMQAARVNGIDVRNSWMIGDRESDILCGRNAGCPTIWIRNSVHAIDLRTPSFIAESWWEIERIIQAADSTG